MANITDIIAREKQRNDVAQCRVAYLYREGNFLRAYEWSAWLFDKFSSGLKISTRQSKAAGQSVSMVGFPPSSMDKFAPKDALIEPQIDGSITVTLSVDAIPDATDIKTLLSEYDEWKSKQIVEEPKGGKNVRDTPFDDEATVETVCTPSLHQRQHPRPVTLTTIMHQILAYPLEQKTPVDNMIFISELKRQLLSLI